MDLNEIFAWNFQDVWESTMSNLCHIKFHWENCFVWITVIITKARTSDQLDAKGAKGSVIE